MAEDGMIVCGWCNADTAPGRCSMCGRDPALPWVQRGSNPPVVTPADRYARFLAVATAAIQSDGLEPTIERLAARLDVDPRTVRRWRQMSAARPSGVRTPETKVSL
jgi:hypothetical protein